MRGRLSTWSLLLLACCEWAAAVAFAAEDDVEAGDVRQEVAESVRASLSPLLAQYCKDACFVLGVNVDMEVVASEAATASEEEPEDSPPQTEAITRVAAEIQIDDRVSVANRERLTVILRNGLLAFGPTVEILWRPVTLPQIGNSAFGEEQLKRGVQQRVAAVAEQVFGTYCPEQCVLSHVAVAGRLVAAAETVGVPLEELVHDPDGNVLRLDGIAVEVGMDSSLGEGTRAKLVELLKTKTRFAAPLSIDVRVTEFPESFSRRRERELAAANDALGVGRLRETLRLLRDYSDAKSGSVKPQSKVEAPLASASKATVPPVAPSPLVRAPAPSESKTEGTATVWALLAGGTLFLLGLAAAVALRFVLANRDARLMMAAVDPVQMAPAEAKGARPTVIESPDDEGRNRQQELSMKLQSDKMRQEMVAVFVSTPRVAQETFTRLLDEEGVAQTARYVHLFGHLVVFELLDDAHLQRDLVELSEYYQRAQLDLSVEEQHRLLTNLKARVTANEIRVMTQKQADKFDFLRALDAAQVHALIVDEKVQVQSIVMTQLEGKRRRLVFDLFVGPAKVELMRVLYRTEAVPKDYLANVALALHKKIRSRPEFDAAPLRSGDVLLDLVERADFSEQKSLVLTLMRKDQEAARSVKQRLITLEILPYLREAQILEAILGLSRLELATFLAGTREPIRTLILSKAPRDLAARWQEDLRTRATGGGGDQDAQAYLAVERKVIESIRVMVNRGVVNLSDINDGIFGKPTDIAAVDALEIVGLSSASVMVA